MPYPKDLENGIFNFWDAVVNQSPAPEETGNKIYWSEIKDPPFSATTEIAEIMPETTINIVGGDCDIDASIEIIGGNSYTVKWNGTVYECVAQAMSVGGEEYYLIGNTGFLDMDNTGEPFLICKIVTSEGAMAQVIVKDGLSSSVNTMSIVGVKETVKKIDKKYLPDDIGGSGSEPIIFTTMDFMSVTCNKTFEDCVTALNKFNTNVVLSFGGQGFITCSTHTLNNYSGQEYGNILYPNYQFIFDGSVITIDYLPNEINITMPV